MQDPTSTIKQLEELGLQDLFPAVELLPSWECWPGMGRVCVELHVTAKLRQRSGEQPL